MGHAHHAAHHVPDREARAGQRPRRVLRGPRRHARDVRARVRNASLRGVAFGYLLCITGYNVAAIFITFLLEAVWRSILENFRPVAVWGTDLALFYVFTAGGFGEAWTVWSWLELAGMIVLLLGTAVYNGSVHVPGLDYFPELQRQYSISDSVLGSPLIAGALSPTGTAVAPEKRAAERQLIQAGEPTYTTPPSSRQVAPLMMKGRRAARRLIGACAARRDTSEGRGGRDVRKGARGGGGGCIARRAAASPERLE